MNAMITTFRRSFPFSLRLQMAAWYTTSFALLLLFTGAVFYQYLEHALEASVDTDLQLRAQQIAAGAVNSNGTLSLRNVTGDLPGFSSRKQNVPAQPVDVNYGVLVRLLDARGQLLGETPAFQLLSVPAASVRQPLQGTPWQGTIETPEGREVRLYSRTLTDQGKTVAVIQVGESLANLHALLHQLVAALLVVGFLVLLVCAAGSYWLAARSFAPIRRLAETARKIRAGDLHQRVPLPPVHDEVQYLAVTLNEMLDSLDQSFSRQRRFVADASHELRTPVAAIRSKTDLALLQPRTQQEYITVLQGINTEAERLGYLISDLLALARGDEGQTVFDCEPVRLDLLVEAVAANAEPLAALHGVTLKVQTRGPITMVGDEARLIQVIMNLVDNAICYTNPGGSVTLLVGAGHAQAHVAVRDSGIGIAPEHLPHIFERFYRVDAARTRKAASSSGLGLSIVEWVVRAHGGSVAVESRVGQGSCFTVMLPLAPTSEKS